MKVYMENLGISYILIKKYIYKDILIKYINKKNNVFLYFFYNFLKMSCIYLLVLVLQISGNRLPRKSC